MPLCRPEDFISTLQTETLSPLRYLRGLALGSLIFQLLSFYSKTSKVTAAATGISHLVFFSSVRSCQHLPKLHLMSLVLLLWQFASFKKVAQVQG